MKELQAARSARLFATPMLEHVWADGAELNVALRAAILAEAQRHPGDARTNVGGWHSQVGRLEFCGAAGERLVRHMIDMTQEATRRLYAEYGRAPEALEWVLSAWANVNGPGHFNTMHTHPGATWSGVYYVDDGEDSADTEGTAIHLSDPNAARTNLFFPDLSTADVMFRPAPGLMILFPSHVPHMVPPHGGTRARISIAFNVRKEPFP